MNLLKKTEKYFKDDKGILSDENFIAINRKDYYIGESAPIDGFYSLFSNIEKIKSYQELELMNNSLAFIELIYKNKNIKIENLSVSTINIYYYILVNFYKNKILKVRNVMTANQIKYNNNYAKEILESYEDYKLKENEKSNITIIDALDKYEFEFSYEEFKVDKEKKLMIIKNGTHIDASFKTNPYSINDIKHIFSVTGAMFIYKK
jgi:hypothetical protein